MELLIGLDVGTTATKALLFDLTGRVIASATRSYGLIMPRPGWVEQDPEEIWRAVVETLRALSRECSPRHRIVALSLSSQGGTTIPVAADGHPIYNAISWMDERAREQAEHVREKWGAEFIRTTTGWPLMSGLPLQHIGWLRQNRPAEFAATRHFLFVNDFIIQRLTGQLCMNPSDASITQLFNIATGDWDERLLDIVGLTRDRVSPVCPSGHAVGTVTAAASEATGLPQDVLVVNGAHDQYCAAVGTGVTRPGPTLLSCGTAWVILAVPESLEVALRSGMAVSCHAVKGHWGVLRSLGGVGTALEWLLDNVWGGKAQGEDRERLYNAINESVAASPPGANRLLFYPLAGGHATVVGTGRGAFIGLSLAHSRNDLARAVMEGIAFELRWAVEETRKAGIKVTELEMVGGAAKSSVWPHIIADITGVPVTLPAVREAASRGAAILAGVGAGLFPDPEAGFVAFRGKETYLEPASENRNRYEDLFATYQELFHLLVSRLSALNT